MGLGYRLPQRAQKIPEGFNFHLEAWVLLIQIQSDVQEVKESDDVLHIIEDGGMLHIGPSEVSKELPRLCGLCEEVQVYLLPFWLHVPQKPGHIFNLERRGTRKKC